MSDEPLNELLMGRFDVEAVLADSRRVPAVIWLGSLPKVLATMRVQVEGIPPADARESDYFEALRAVRRQMDRYGVKLLVNGARRDVWASGMAREMGMGMKVYLMERDKPATRLVNLLDPCDESLVGTVDEQDDFMFECSGFRPSKRAT